MATVRANGTTSKTKAGLAAELVRMQAELDQKRRRWRKHGSRRLILGSVRRRSASSPLVPRLHRNGNCAVLGSQWSDGLPGRSVGLDLGYRWRAVARCRVPPGQGRQLGAQGWLQQGGHLPGCRWRWPVAVLTLPRRCGLVPRFGGRHSPWLVRGDRHRRRSGGDGVHGSPDRLTPLPLSGTRPGPSPGQGNG